MPKSVIIGLTGGFASGKTTVANYLQTLGAYLIDTDLIARAVVEPNTATTLAIKDLLGEDYLLPDGNLNRPKIKQHIFNNTSIKVQYEGIILPAIRKATLTAIKNIPDDVCYTLLIVPLLFEKGLDAHTDYNISVDIPVEEQIRRGIHRNAMDESVVRQIIAAQMPREDRNRQADFVIDNTQELTALYAELDKLHTLLCQLSPKQHKTQHYAQ